MHTYLGAAIDAAGYKAQYDTCAKKLLSDVNILAWILKYTTEEFRTYDIPTITNCIEGVPAVSERAVMPGLTKEALSRAIEGLPQEDKVLGEGILFYDIRFKAVTPDSKAVEIIIDVEAQKKFLQTYDIVTRGILYAARMLSGQLGQNIVKSNYQNAKKVYSIWLCFSNIPIEYQNSITEYSISPKNIYGTMTNHVRYDLLSVVIVCLGKQESQNPLHQMLSVLMSDHISPREKKQRIEQEFSIPVTEKMQREMNEMCNLSDLVEERGIEKGIEKGLNAIISLVKDGLISMETAAERLEMTRDEFEKLYHR